MQTLKSKHPIGQRMPTFTSKLGIWSVPNLVSVLLLSQVNMVRLRVIVETLSKKATDPGCFEK